VRSTQNSGGIKVENYLKTNTCQPWSEVSLTDKLSRLKRDVAGYLAEVDADVGVGFKDLSSGGEFYVKRGKRFLTASVFKVYLLADLYRRVNEGKFDLDATVQLEDADRSPGSGVLQYLQPGVTLRLRDLAKLMMIISDNTATDILMRVLGKSSVADTLEWLGLKNTRVAKSTKEHLCDMYQLEDEEAWTKFLGIRGIHRGGPSFKEEFCRHVHRIAGVQPISSYPLFEKLGIDKSSKAFTDFEDNDVTSPDDLVVVFEAFYSGKMFGERASEVMDIMASCETGAGRIKSALPKHAVLAHKTGTVPGVVNDAGIVMVGDKKYILTVLVNGLKFGKRANYVGKGEKIISRISKMVYSEVVRKEG
jgi:beta-lactamase class A